VLIFANFFLFEVTAKLRIHPLQYLMVGGALVLFFLGYLALSEFIAAGLAYGVAAAASTLLVTSYSASVLKTGRRCLVIGGGLAGTYGYLYFILQLEDYALLAGTAALFALLGVAMWATRKIDWYGGK
jgi:inner membrane protein